MLNVFWILFAYILGGIPFGLILAQSLCGIDPREAGSRNTGATNVARLCGTRIGIGAMACDILKGFIPVCVASLTPHSDFALSLVALAAIFGHAYSPFMNFKGGKSVATTVGAFLGLSFWAAIWPILACAAVIALSGFVSMGSLTLAVLLPVFCLLTGNVAFLPAAVIAMLLLFWRHKENIQRLAKGEEKPWRKKKDE